MLTQKAYPRELFWLKCLFVVFFTAVWYILLDNWYIGNFMLLFFVDHRELLVHIVVNMHMGRCFMHGDPIATCLPVDLNQEP